MRVCQLELTRLASRERGSEWKKTFNNKIDKLDVIRPSLNKPEQIGLSMLSSNDSF